MKKVIQTPAGFQTVDSKNPLEVKYFNAEELAMKLCEDCKAFTITAIPKGVIPMSSVEPKIIEIERPVIVEKEKIVYIDNPIVTEKIVYVDRPVISEKIIKVEVPKVVERTIVKEVEVKVPVVTEKLVNMPNPDVYPKKKWWEFWK